MANVDTARAAYESFASGDQAKLAEQFAEDAVWKTSDELPFGGVTEGREAILANFGNIRKIWSEFAVEPEDFIDGGEKVVVQGTQRAIAAEGGGRFESSFLHLMEFDREGRISRAQFLTDTAKALKALN